VTATYVLVHGGWLGAWSWEGVVQRLEAAGHRAYAVDLPGHGGRRHEAVRRPTGADYAAAVVERLTELDLRDVVLVGHSLGGLTVQLVAQQVPERLARMVWLSGVVVADGRPFVDDFPPGSFDGRLAEAQGRPDLAF
jgi:pimeloyl-ACP methyl ester carboxylesterase